MIENQTKAMDLCPRCWRKGEYVEFEANEALERTRFRCKECRVIWDHFHILPLPPRKRKGKGI